MEVIKKFRQEAYETYRTSDGRTFTSKTEAQNHEGVLKGDRKICPACKGEGRVNYRYIEYEDRWEGTRKRDYISDHCTVCDGNKYLTKQTVWR